MRPLSRYACPANGGVIFIVEKFASGKQRHKDSQSGGTGYAIRVADDSFAWYRTAAIRSRRFHRLSAVSLQAAAAAIPLAAVLNPSSTTVPALLGGLIVILSGLRAVFHWNENYLRFSVAREAVEAQRRLYHTASPPYDDAEIRDQVLVGAVTAIEQAEMASWVSLAAAERRRLQELAKTHANGST